MQQHMGQPSWESNGATSGVENLSYWKGLAFLLLTMCKMVCSLQTHLFFLFNLLWGGSGHFLGVRAHVALNLVHCSFASNGTRRQRKLHKAIALRRNSGMTSLSRVQDSIVIWGWCNPECHIIWAVPESWGEDSLLLCNSRLGLAV